MNVKIMGADQSVTNRSGNDYITNLQVTTARSRLYKLTFSPLAGMAADVYVWIFDNATGVLVAPVAVRLVPAGVADTWDFGPDGSLFQSGILVRAASAAPTDATTDATGIGAGSNKIIMKADIRIG